jgi:acetolactate synthase-1/2/3 large subunit
MKISVARLIVEFLKEAGVPYLFGLSGHSIFPITDALYSEPDLRFISVMHELSAAYMTAAYAKGTRTLGVCTASAGAGVTNLLTGIAYAHKESIPVIVLAADVSRRHAGKGASSWHEIPQREMFEPITKLSVTLENADQAVDTLRRALKEATTGRKGPVYIGIPRDLQEQEVEGPGSGWLETVSAIVEPDEGALDQAAEELNKALAPIIIAGGGVYWSRAEQELRELVELLSIPFGTSPSHKGLISEDHPMSLGVLGFGAFPFANPFCLKSDLILAVGCHLQRGPHARLRRQSNTAKSQDHSSRLRSARARQDLPGPSADSRRCESGSGRTPSAVKKSSRREKKSRSSRPAPGRKK